MRLRQNEGGTYEAECTSCQRWLLAGNEAGPDTTYLYLSTQALREQREGTPVTIVDGYLGERRYDNGFREGYTRAYRGRCRSCEASRVRPRTRTALSREGRAFGVELELTGPSASAIITALHDAGVRVNRSNLSRLRELGYTATNGDDNCWTLKHDSSVSGFGLELVSPKLFGADGFEQLRKVCATLQSIGATVDRTAGCHVHVDFRGATLNSMKAQLLGILVNQENVMRMMAPSRRSNGYCPSWRDAQVDNFRALTSLSQLDGIGPRGTVNLWSYSRHGSVEFRSHGGTTSFKKLGAWVRFLLGALDANAAAEGAGLSVRTFESPLQLCNHAGLNSEDRDQLLRFERAAEDLEASEYSMVEVTS